MKDFHIPKLAPALQPCQEEAKQELSKLYSQLEENLKELQNCHFDDERAEDVLLAFRKLIKATLNGASELATTMNHVNAEGQAKENS